MNSKHYRGFSMQRCSQIFFIIVSCLLTPCIVSASKFSYKEQEDPFSDGVCWMPSVLSFNRTELLDSERLGINWPKGTLGDIVLCESGYVSFKEHFDLADNEKSTIQEFLDNLHWIDFKGIRTFPLETLIWLLEETYKRRQVEPIFWLEFHQVAAQLGRNIEGLRRARMFEVFETQYDEFQGDAKVHYVMSGYYARAGLMPEACESLHRGDQIMMEKAHDLSDEERTRLLDYKAYAIADLLSSEDIRFGKTRVSDCEELRRENEHVPEVDVSAH